MKRTASILLVFSIIILSQTLAAQHRIGVIGGLNIADLRITEPDDGSVEESSRDNKFGIGGLFALDIGQQFYLQIQPTYLVKGGTAVPDPGDPEFRFTANYLEIPLLIQKTFGTTVKPYVLGGPTLGFLLSNEVDAELNGTEFTADLKDVSETLDFGLTVGAGVLFPINNFVLFLESRYTHGISDVLEGGPIQFKAGDLVLDEELEPEVEVRTRGISIMTGISIPLNGGNR